MGAPSSDVKHEVAVDQCAPSSPKLSRSYSARYDTLATRYRGQTIEVNFRQLVGPLPADDLTHGIYPYPARLLRQIPRFVLGSRTIMDGVDYVADPFCGSGTVLLEAQRRGIRSFGCDQNPIAALSSRVKTTPAVHIDLRLALYELIAAAKVARSLCDYPAYLEKWYAPNESSVLRRILSVKRRGAGGAETDFIDLVIALTARRFSVADPRIPVPVRVRCNENVRPRSFSHLWRMVEELGLNLAEKISRLHGQDRLTTVICADARKQDWWDELPPSSRGVMFSSPPYGAAQKYIRSTSLEAGWLGYSTDAGTIDLERNSVGREHIGKHEEIVGCSTLPRQIRRDLTRIEKLDRRRALIYTHYFCDMKQVLEKAANQSGIERVVLVVGDNVVAGTALKTSSHIATLLQEGGFRQTMSLRDTIRGRTLLTIRKNMGSPAISEYLKVFER